MVIVPSNAVDTTNLGGLMGTTAMVGMAQEMIPEKKAVEDWRDEKRDVAG
jgi:hypothetical protein